MDNNQPDHVNAIVEIARDQIIKEFEAKDFSEADRLRVANNLLLELYNQTCNSISLMIHLGDKESESLSEGIAINSLPTALKVEVSVIKNKDFDDDGQFDMLQDAIKGFKDLMSDK